MRKWWDCRKEEGSVASLLFKDRGFWGGAKASAGEATTFVIAVTWENTGDVVVMKAYVNNELILTNEIADSNHALTHYTL